MEFNNSQNYRPPEALRWLALTSGAEACEVLEYAEKALVRSGRTPKDIVTKAIGVGRLEELAKNANNLGRAWLVASQDVVLLPAQETHIDAENLKQRLLVAGRPFPPSHRERASKISILSPLTTLQFRKCATECFEFAESIVGGYGAASINRGLVEVVSGYYDKAIDRFIKISVDAIDDRTQEIAFSSITLTLLARGQFTNALSSLRFVSRETDLDNALASYITRVAIAAHVQDPNLLEEAYEFAAEAVSGSPYEGVLYDRVKYLITDLDPVNQNNSQIKRYLNYLTETRKK